MATFDEVLDAWRKHVMKRKQHSKKKSERLRSPNRYGHRVQSGVPEGRVEETPIGTHHVIVNSEVDRLVTKLTEQNLLNKWRK